MATKTTHAGSRELVDAEAPIVEIHHAVKRFGPTVALNDLSLTIRRGESHGIIGRNGAGKSTLVSVLTGLNAIDSGSFLLNGAEPPPRTDRRGWLGAVSCVYQHRTLVPGLTEPFPVAAVLAP